MKLALDKGLHDLQGELLPQPARFYVFNSLNNANVQKTGEEKYKIGELIEKTIKADAETDFPIDEVKMMKDAVGEACAPTIVKQLWDILEGK